MSARPRAGRGSHFRTSREASQGMIWAITVPTSAKESIKKFKTAIFASALSAGLIVLILLVRETTVSNFRRAFETVFWAFPLGVIGANAYIWLAAKFSILGQVTRTNLAATLKALLIVTPIAMVISFAGIAPQDAQIWIYVEILLSCVISDAAYVDGATR
jgi:hypothetical protein